MSYIEPTFNFLVPYLNEKSTLHVKEATCYEQIVPSTVYVAPPSYHLLIEQDYSFSLSVEEPVKFCRPSIDVLFESAALAYQSSLIGLILTGANDDGAWGCQRIKKHGGVLIAQDPASAESPQMPQAAIQMGVVDYVADIERIASLLLELTGR